MRHGRTVFALTVQVLCTVVLLLLIAPSAGAATQIEGVVDVSSGYSQAPTCQGDHLGTSIISLWGNMTASPNHTKEPCQCLQCAMSVCGSTAAHQGSNGLNAFFDPIRTDPPQPLITYQSAAHHDAVLPALFRPPIFLLH